MFAITTSNVADYHFKFAGGVCKVDRRSRNIANYDLNIANDNFIFTGGSGKVVNGNGDAIKEVPREERNHQ